MNRTNIDPLLPADGDAALLRVEIEELRSLGRHGRHELLRRQYASLDAVRPDDCHAILDAVDAVRNLCEVVLAHRLLIRIERAVQ